MEVLVGLKKIDLLTWENSVPAKHCIRYQNEQVNNFTTHLSWLLHLGHVGHLVCYLSWHLRHLTHWLTLNLSWHLTTHLSWQLNSHLGWHLTWTSNIWHGPWLHLPWHSNHLSDLQYADSRAMTTNLKLNSWLQYNKSTNYSSEISPTRCNNCVFILLNGFTLHVSGDNLTHHQEYICCIWPQVSRLT